MGQMERDAAIRPNGHDRQNVIAEHLPQVNIYQALAKADKKVYGWIMCISENEMNRSNRGK